VYFYNNSHLFMDDKDYGMNSINLGTGVTTYCETGRDFKVASIAAEIAASEITAVIVTTNSHIIVRTVYTAGHNERSGSKQTTTQPPRPRWKCPDLGGFNTKVIIVSGKIVLTHRRQNSILCYDKTGKTIFRKELPEGFHPRGMAKYGDTGIIISGDSSIARFTFPDFEPVWQTELEGAAGVCVDDQGLIYVGVWRKKAIIILTSSGELYFISKFPLSC